MESHLLNTHRDVMEALDIRVSVGVHGSGSEAMAPFKA
jgi:hypothetical protein